MSKNTNLIGGLNFKTGNCKQLQPSAKAKKIVTPEEIIQVDFFDWVFKNERAFPVLRWIHHVPNGGYRHPAIAVKMKLQGVRAGVCDCFLPVARNGFHGLYIEMKTETGKLSENQARFIEFVKSENYHAVVRRSCKEAAETVVEYLGLPISTKYLK